jgi:hypothetical protein
VRFGALDNAPHDVVLDPETHHAYQQTYFHALGKDTVAELIERYYTAFFNSLSEACGTGYIVETYTDQQAAPGFRAEFLRTLERLDDIRWWLAPSHGTVHIRIPCPDCGWAVSNWGQAPRPQKRADVPSWSGSTRTAPPSPRSAWTTAPTKRTSTPRTTNLTWTWPPSTATWSRNAPLSATPTCCT